MVGEEGNAASVLGANFSAGFVAGSIAAAATCPLDVAKTRRQIEVCVWPVLLGDITGIAYSLLVVNFANVHGSQHVLVFGEEAPFCNLIENIFLLGLGWQLHCLHFM